MGKSDKSELIKLAGGMVYTIVLELAERKNAPTAPEVLAQGVVAKAIAVGGSVPPQFKRALLSSTIPSGVKLNVFQLDTNGHLTLGPRGWVLVADAVVHKVDSISADLPGDFSRG